MTKKRRRYFSVTEAACTGANEVLFVAFAGTALTSYYGLKGPCNKPPPRALADWPSCVPAGAAASIVGPVMPVPDKYAFEVTDK